MIGGFVKQNRYLTMMDGSNIYTKINSHTHNKKCKRSERAVATPRDYGTQIINNSSRIINYDLRK